jgi:hypothetical protein|tara:strand:+ start:353 stop:577 length:225 start_codon:yes stop_codon:yes gene_type:complete
MKHRDISFSNTSDDICSSVTCNNQVKRSVSRKKVDAFSSLNVEGTGKKVSLCQDCYRIFKKETKKDRAMESFGR